jgi:hypothetical protein
MSASVQYTCGVDIGTENLAISFIEVSWRSAPPRIISYKGSLSKVLRFERDVETTVISQSGKAGPSEDYVGILCAIPEFSQTVQAVIEMQLAFNHSAMSRLDGVAYGFLRGRFPSMVVSLNAATIRKKFIAEQLGNEDISNYMIPRGYPATKVPSIFFVAVRNPPHYEYILSNREIDKIDDICDSIVYASIARLRMM